jgi:hypothetical protein
MREGPRRGSRQGDKLPGQQVAGQVVDLEPEFVAVAREDPFVVRDTRAHPGIVDQQVDAGVGLADRGGQFGDLGERREIGAEEARRADAPGFDRPHHFVAPLLASAVHDDVVAVGGELEGKRPTEPVGRPGDERDGGFPGGLGACILRGRGIGGAQGREQQQGRQGGGSDGELHRGHPCSEGRCARAAATPAVRPASERHRGWSAS